MKEKIIQFIKQTRKEKNSMYYLTNSSRLTTVYWYVSSLRILNQKILDKEEIIDFVLRCKNTDSFFGANINYPSTLLSTLNALQILYSLNYHYYDENILNKISSFLNDTGSFKNDVYGEIDTRFLCCGILIIHFMYISSKYTDCKLEYLDEPIPDEFIEKNNINKKMIINYILQAENIDGGFGAEINSESHTANIFCCITALKSLNSLHLLDEDKILNYLIFRQTKNGGLNGRINKKEDVCYSFWTYSSLYLLGKNSFIDEEKLKNFVVSCMDESGGFSDRPGNEPDLYHTLYALASLSMMNELNLNNISPGFGI